MDLNLPKVVQKRTFATDYVEHVKITWAIKDLRFSNVPDISLESSRFNLENLTSWFITLKPQFGYRNAVLNLHRIQTDDGPPFVSVCFRFGLKDGTKEKWFTEHHAEFQPGDSKSEVFEFLPRLSKNETLVLCQIMIVKEIYSMPELYDNSSQISFMSDFYSLSKTGYLNDFTLDVSGTLIKAHKAILAERSLFFRNLFSNKNYNSSLKLSDVNLNEVNNILAFVYSGNFYTWSKVCSKKLAAYDCLVKFGVEFLKDMLAPTEINLFSECKASTVQLTWQVDLLNCRNPDYVSVSPTFETQIGSAYIMHYPKNLPGSDTVSITIEPSCPINNLVAAHIDFSILDSSKNKINQQWSSKITKLNKAYEISFKIERGWIKRMKSHLLPDDVPTISCKIKVTNCEAKDSCIHKINFHINDPFLSFASLLKSENFSDFTIIAGDQTFKVHKAILAARSNYFYQLFINYKENSITIADLRPTTLKLLLSYVYSGKICVDIESGLELQTVSDKYSVTLLSNLLNEFFLSKCNPDDVCHLISRADTWKVENAKNLALNFLTLNLNSVQETEKWKCFVLENKELALEILSKVSKHHRSLFIEA